MSDILLKEKVETSSKDNCIELWKIDLNVDYKKKWGITSDDIYCLCKNGELIRPTLYRIGGLSTKADFSRGGYFLLLKQVESMYSADEVREYNLNSSGYICQRWVIVDHNGNEVVEFERFNRPYLVKNSIFYKLNSYIVNILTGEEIYYGEKTFESSDYIFIDNMNYSAKGERGVYKINKKDGSIEIFK